MFSPPPGFEPWCSRTKASVLPMSYTNSINIRHLQLFIIFFIVQLQMLYSQLDDQQVASSKSLGFLGPKRLPFPS